jgi:lipoate-protein ligase A
MSTLWRLIDTGALDCSANMAVDEALLRSQGAPDAPPVLRLYGWTTPAITVGRFQQVRSLLDLDRCQERYIPVLRRFTGGGLVYHSNDLAYSIICSSHHLPGYTGPDHLSRSVFSALHSFYGRLGLSAAPFSDTARSCRTGNPLCCVGREPWDIVVAGRKVGGHAMRRQRMLLFQHGTIPLLTYASELLPLLRCPPDRALPAACLGDFGPVPMWGDLSRLVVEAFRETIPGDLVADTLHTGEEKLARELMGNKYGRTSWNLEGAAA